MAVMRNNTHQRMHALTGELCSPTCFRLAGILVLVGGAILPAQAVTASTRISARLRRVLVHSAPVIYDARRSEGRLKSRGGLRLRIRITVYDVRGL